MPQLNGSNTPSRRVFAGAFWFHFFEIRPCGTLVNGAPSSFISCQELPSTKQKLHRGEPLLRRDSCPREDAGSTRLVCFGSALAAVIRAKRTTSEKSLLTHYLGAPGVHAIVPAKNASVG